MSSCQPTCQPVSRQITAVLWLSMVKFKYTNVLSMVKLLENMAEAAFSEDGKYYSTISQDGRLKIWDTETNVFKQEYTPDLHLSSPPSCLQWINVTLTAVSTTRGFNLVFL